MTTPSAYRRLNKAAELYVQFLGTAMVLCDTVDNMHAQLMIDDVVPDTEKKIIQDIATNVERAFKQQLEPLIERLRNLEKEIRAGLPNPNKLIVTSDDDVN